MSPPKNKIKNKIIIKNKEENFELSVSAVENNESIDVNSILERKSSEMSFNINKTVSELGNEGLSKIKKKLSLKVVIPDENRKGSMSDSNVY